MSNSCRNCPYISIGGDIGSDNCIKRAIQAYQRDYQGHEALFLRCNGKRRSKERVYMCCQGGIAYREACDEEVNYIHHVLLVEYQEGGFFRTTYYDMIDIDRKDTRLKSIKEAKKILKNRYGIDFYEVPYTDYQEFLVWAEGIEI